MKPEHMRMSRMLGYCLTLGTSDAWAGFSFAAAVRLLMRQNTCIATSLVTCLIRSVSCEVRF